MDSGVIKMKLFVATLVIRFITFSKKYLKFFLLVEKGLQCGQSWDYFETGKYILAHLTTIDETLKKHEQ